MLFSSPSAITRRGYRRHAAIVRQACGHPTVLSKSGGWTSATVSCTLGTGSLDGDEEYGRAPVCAPGQLWLQGCCTASKDVQVTAVDPGMPALFAARTASLELGRGCGSRALPDYHSQRIPG